MDICTFELTLSCVLRLWIMRYRHLHTKHSIIFLLMERMDEVPTHDYFRLRPKQSIKLFHILLYALQVLKFHIGGKPNHCMTSSLHLDLGIGSRHTALITKLIAWTNDAGCQLPFRSRAVNFCGQTLIISQRIHGKQGTVYCLAYYSKYRYNTPGSDCMHATHIASFQNI